VGRPNVGKSSLFNALTGRRIAIVDPTAGVTRDRISAPVKAGPCHFELVDTGGMGGRDPDNLTALVETQIQAAIEQAELVLFVVDGRAGLTPLDEHVAGRLRAVSRPVILVANKCDTPRIDLEIAEFYKLGRTEVVPVSAQQKRGLKELVTLIAQRLPKADQPASVSDVALKVAIVGRRNTGKSTFINSLAQSGRVIVSETPGTTRDSIDVRFERDGKAFIAIDTAGVRRKQSLASDIEFYSLARAERSIRRADVVLLFLDPQRAISKVDKQLALYVLENYKPAVFVVNKWDLVAPLPTGRFGALLRATFPSLDYVPISFVTAKNGRNVYKVLNLAQNLYKQAGYRAGTGDLNRILRDALAAQAPPMRQNRRPKIYYATQVAAFPPTIVLFTNGPDLFDITYERYLLKAFRDNLPYTDVPIKLLLRRRPRREAQAESSHESSEVVKTVRPRVNPSPSGRRRAASSERKPNKSKAQKRVRSRDVELWTDL
jgi:GTP-binding protein